MDALTLKKIAECLIKQINEINSDLKALKLKMTCKESKDVNAFSKLLIDKFVKLGEISESHFVLPEKLIDNIFILIVNFLDALFQYGNSNFNDIGQILIPMIIKFITVEQNFSSLNLSFKCYVNKKWKFIEKILIFVLSLVDKYEINKDFDLQNMVKIIFNFLDSTYNSLEDLIHKYKIMPGLISKLIKFMTFKNLKITSKTVLKVDVILRGNYSLLFELMSNKTLPENFDKNLISYFDFYNLFYMKIKERIDSNKFEKIINSLVESNLLLVNKLEDNKDYLTKICFGKNIKYEEFFLNRLKLIFEFLNSTILKTNQTYPEIFFHEYLKLNSSNKEELEEKISETMKALVSSKNKEEFQKFNSIMTNYLLFLNSYLCLFTVQDISEFLERINDCNLINFLNNENKNYKLNEILNDSFDILFKNCSVTETLILGLANTYEIQIMNVDKNQAKEKCNNIINDCFQYSNELNFSMIKRFILLLIKTNEKIYNFFLISLVDKLKNSFKKFKKQFSYVEEVNITIKDFKILIEDLLNSYAKLYFFLSAIDNLDFKLNTDINMKKNLLLFKQYNIYFSNFLADYPNQLITINENKILLLKTFIILTNAFLFEVNSKIFNKNERNSFLMLALGNYCNKVELIKYASILALIQFTSDSNNKLQLKTFIKDNFDFIINTTINKIIYYDCNTEVNSNKVISNFKLDFLNFFNSLILLMNDLDDEKLSNFYCGEMNKFIKRIFVYFDEYLKNKNFVNLECLLEIIQRITNFQDKIIKRKFKIFEINYSSSQNDKENDPFAEFLKDEINIIDSNLYRNLILRILPILLSDKIVPVVKSIKIFQNLVSTLFLLPMKREEKANFSTEDGVNVQVKNSLGPIMHESWGYFIYILNFPERTKQTNSSNYILKIVENILDLFFEVSKIYPKFFNNVRLGTDLVPSISKLLIHLEISYTMKQLHPIITKLVNLLYSTLANQEGTILSEKTITLVSDLLNIMKNKEELNLNLEEKQKINLTLSHLARDDKLP